MKDYCPCHHSKNAINCRNCSISHSQSHSWPPKRVSNNMWVWRKGTRSLSNNSSTLPPIRSWLAFLQALPTDWIKCSKAILALLIKTQVNAICSLSDLLYMNLLKLLNCFLEKILYPTMNLGNWLRLTSVVKRSQQRLQTI